MTKVVALILRVDGTHRVELEFEYTLKAMQEVVGGYIELVRLSEKQIQDIES